MALIQQPTSLSYFCPTLAHRVCSLFFFFGHLLDDVTLKSCRHHKFQPELGVGASRTPPFDFCMNTTTPAEFPADLRNNLSLQRL